MIPQKASKINNILKNEKFCGTIFDIIMLGVCYGN